MLSDQDLLLAAENLRAKGYSWRRVAAELGYSAHSAMLRRLRKITGAASTADIDKGFIVSPPPSPDLPIDHLIEHRIRRFERKRAYEEGRKCIPVNVTLEGPVGILHFGDPHVDDDGTDLAALRHHSDLVRETEGLFGGNVGDTTNNWVGRLARLYGEQSTTASEAWQLAEWFISRTPWLYMIGGNHDAWSGAGDPLRWIAAQQKALYESSEARLELRFPNGRTCRINARHDFAGHSQWNPAHGVGKSIQMGTWDDIAVCGHKHVSGYMLLKHPVDGRVCHAIQVASYKLYDRYARERGFRDQQISPAVVTIIDPDATRPTQFIHVFHDVDEGVEFLKWKRRRQRA